MEGVWRTRVGYAGGDLESPTYRRIGDHTECFEVDFDPSVIGFDDLLELVWTSHDPTREAFKTQYASVILAHDDEQLVAARESAERLSSVTRRRVVTRIEPLKRFWLAEDYHQKYYLRHDRLLLGEIRQAYPLEADFVASTAAARLNGYIHGSGSCLQLDRELPKLGLSENGQRHLSEFCKG